MTSETYYTTLGVDPTANQATIRKAYLKLSLKYHPDKNPNNEEAAKEQFVKIGEAYEVISDPTSRSAYDRDLASGGSGGGAGFTSTYQRPSPQSYETYREAFDDRVGRMSEEELRAAMGAAAVIGGLVGSLVGSGLARKVAGNSAVGRAIFETAGTLIGSTVGSEASVNLLQNVHTQSRDRITYEERKRVAMERGGPIPDKPKEGWGDLKDTVNKTMNTVKSQMQGNDDAQPATARGQAFSNVFGAMKNAKKMMEMKEKAATYRR
jgi:hypothetical protein